MKKTCKECGKAYPATGKYFGRYTRARDGFKTKCRKCTNQNQNDYAKRNRDKYNSYHANWVSKNKERHHSIVMDNHYRRYYGISLEDYNRLFNKQNGCCAICHRPQSDFRRALSVDHNHVTGKVRVLLCPNCNMVLGKIEAYSDEIRGYLDE